MSRRSGTLALLVVLAGTFPLVFAPLAVGPVRLAGVSLAWWYVAAAPIAAAAVTAFVLARGPAAGTLGGVSAWTSPVLFGAVATAVFAGDPGGPILVLGAGVAPLVAVLAGGGRGPHGPLAGFACVVGVALVLWANIALLAEVAGGFGLRRWQAVAIAAPLVALPPLAAWTERRRLPLVAIALGVLGAALVVVGTTLGATPWAAWAEVASRPALVFADESPWVTAGRRIAVPTTLVFSESHRITAAGPGVYRVLERDGAPGTTSSRAPVAREWRLATGDSLTLRPGDELALDAGAHVRFEAGKRVPGVAVSGVRWADPPERRSAASALAALGVAVTLLVGALALAGSLRAPPRGGAAGLGVIAALAVSLGAAAWGIYAIRGAADLALGAPAPQIVLALPGALVPRPWSGVVVVMTAGALVLLACAAATALRGCLDDALELAPGYRPAVWVAVATAACMAALWPADVWRVLLTGLGFAGAVAVAPRLAPGGRASRLVGAGVGAAGFALLALAAPRLPGWAAPFGGTPALLAAPLAWLATVVAARVAATRRD